LKDLSLRAIEEWSVPHFKVLTDQAGISEIRFKADNVEQRPLGFHSGQNEYTLLCWSIEKGGKFVPKTICSTAIQRRAAALADRSLSDVLWFALE